MRRAPAVDGGLDDGVDAEHQRRGDQEGANDVGTLAEPDARVVLEQLGGEQRGRDPDRKVDQEDRVPADGLGQDAPGQEADRRARGGHETVDADGPGLIPRLREHGHDHAQDDRRAHRAADALYEPSRDQHLGAPRQAAQQRRASEYHQAGHQDALAADQVAEPSSQE